MASECGFVGTQINNLLALKGADGFPQFFYKYMFFGYDQVLRGKMEMCRNEFKDKLSNEVFVFELRQFVSENVTEAGVRFYLESALSSRSHSYRSVRPDEICHCQVMANVSALKVIDC